MQRDNWHVPQIAVSMATSLNEPPYLQVGPRQGVYRRPTVVVSTWPGGGYHQQQVQHAGGSSMATVKWRMSQFMSPECNYRLRARVDAEKPPSENIPQIKGHIIERPPSASRRETKPPTKVPMSRSSCNLHWNSPSSQPGKQYHTVQQSRKLSRTTSGTCLEVQHDHHRKSSTVPVFSIHACAVTIQSRPFVRSIPTPKRIAPPEEPFPYPDPVKVGGDHAFNVRLAEMAGLQRDTIKNEEFRARIARRNAMVATSSNASNLQANNRQPVRPSSSTTRSSMPSKTGLYRKTSLPAGTVQDKPSLVAECSVSSRQLPVPPKLSSNCTVKLESGASLQHSLAEKPTIMENDEANHPYLCSTGSEIAAEHTTDSLSVTDSNEESSDEDEGIDMQRGCVVQSEVTPKNHHRDLVEAIFSGENRQKQLSNEKIPTKNSLSESHSGTVGETDRDECTHNSSPCHANTISEDGGERNDKEKNSPLKVPVKTAPPTHHVNLTSKSRPTPHIVHTSTETSVASPQVVSPNEASSQSSTSSSSSTPEHPPRKRRHHANRSKSSKTKKHSKKAVRHKKDVHSNK